MSTLVNSSAYFLSSASCFFLEKEFSATVLKELKLGARAFSSFLDLVGSKLRTSSVDIMDLVVSTRSTSVSSLLLLSNKEPVSSMNWPNQKESSKMNKNLSVVRNFILSRKQFGLREVIVQQWMRSHWTCETILSFFVLFIIVFLPWGDQGDR